MGTVTVGGWTFDRESLHELAWAAREWAEDRTSEAQDDKEKGEAK